MNRNLLFHNPRCSKSRDAYQLITGKDTDIEIIEYLKSPPTAEELEYICNYLKIKPVELIRTKENRFSELNLTKDAQKTDSEWFDIMIANPVLIERPILIYNGKVAIGRPLANISDIL